jgi:hypothetical protein
MAHMQPCTQTGTSCHGTTWYQPKVGPTKQIKVIMILCSILLLGQRPPARHQRSGEGAAGQGGGLDSVL